MPFAHRAMRCAVLWSSLYVTTRALVLQRATELQQGDEIEDLRLNQYRIDIYGSSDIFDDPVVIPSSALEVPVLLPGPEDGGSVFRTKTCTADAKPEASQATEVLDMLSVLPKQAMPRIACLAYSYRGARQNMRDSFATWGQDCDVFLPFSDETFHDQQAGFTTIEVHPEDGDERNLVGKLKEVFKEVSRRLSTGELEFDFLTVSGDDAFWLLGNLKDYLGSDPVVQEAKRSGDGVYLGKRFDAGGGHIFNSGAGYVLDRVALDTYQQQECPDLWSGWAEDVFIADCLNANGILPLPTEDGNAQRFNFFDPAGMEMLTYDQTISNDWVAAYSAPFPHEGGLAGISSKSVLFHYVTGQSRYDLHNSLFYRANCEPTR